MKKNKKITSVIVVLFLLVVLVGCKKTPSPTEVPTTGETQPEPTPTESVSNVLIAAFLASDLIEYAQGDNSKSVTQNITLLTSVLTNDIVWTSNNEAITINGNEGIVTRQTTRVNVTLTATLMSDGIELKTRTFELRVIEGEVVSVLFDLGGGDIAGDIYYEVVKGSLLADIGIPTKTGFFFNRWEIEGELFTFDMPIEDSIIVTAVYDRAAVITLDLDEGIFPNQDSLIWHAPIGGTYEVLEELIPEKENYIFVGWFDFDEMIQLTSIVEEDIYLTAKYLPIHGSTLYGTYYDNITASGGLALVNQLNSLVSNGLNNSNRNSSYGEVIYILEVSDINQNNPTKLRGMYDDKAINPVWDSGGTWEREHVWPNSKLATPARVTNSERNQASDPHNLRAINPSTNGTRSNNYFVVGPAAANGYVLPGDKYYPGDGHKGDVARILLFMAIRYRGILTLVETPNLKSTYNANGGDFGDIKVLLNWHIEDPVDEFELNRNQVIFQNQGNRNPFIDKPELFEPIWSQLLEEEYQRQGILERNINTQAQLKLNMTNYVVEFDFRQNLFV